MDIFLVGGAVRDELLGDNPHERDWLVVGGTPEILVSKGFRQVGRDFPVFLHPETREEYALARTERKMGPGYLGFEVHTDPSITLDQDLERRDLTINAIAKSEGGELIDPFGGLRDLESRILRHVSPAFVEDPVRVLRVARFAAKFASRGFRIAEETWALMRQMVLMGEIDALVPERVFREFEKALKEASPQIFIEVLRDIDAMARIFPEINALFGVPQDPLHHPEVDTGLHSLMVLREASKISSDPAVRFAALVHDLGKATTDSKSWPAHPQHEALGLVPLKQLVRRLHLPQRYEHLSQLVVRYHGESHRLSTQNPEGAVQLIEGLDLIRRPESLEPFLEACMADARGRPGFETISYPQAEILREAFRVASSVKAAEISSLGFRGPELGRALKDLRSQRIHDALCRMKID